VSPDLAAFDVIRAVALGFALAAAVGLRIFVPLLVVSAAAFTGHLELSGSFAWLASPAALIVLAVATLLELAAYKVPWLDNLLDAAGAPVAVLAGTLMMASALDGTDPLLRWTMAAVAGGGTAGAVHGSLALLRKLSSLTTGGLANPLISMAEGIGSLALSVVALLLPIAALVAAALIVALLVVLIRRGRARRGGPLPPAAG
jgi:hypothetical protein